MLNLVLAGLFMARMVFQTSAVTLSNRFVSLKEIYLQEFSRQLEMSSTRIYSLGQDNVIRSWLHDGYGYLEFRQFSSSTFLKIERFQLSPDQKQIVFAPYGTQDIWIIDAGSLQKISSMTIPTSILKSSQYISRVFKISSSEFVILTPYSFSSTGNIQNYQIRRINSTSMKMIASFAPVNVSLSSIDMKININMSIIIVWSRYMEAQILSLQGKGIYSLKTIKLNYSNYLSSTEAHFSPDGNRILFVLPSYQDVQVFDIVPNSTATGGFIVKSVNGGPTSSHIQTMQFWGSSNFIAVFHAYKIEFYDISVPNVWNLIDSSSFSINFGPFTRVSVQDRLIAYNIDPYLQIELLRCPGNTDFNDSQSLTCYDPTLPAPVPTPPAPTPPLTPTPPPTPIPTPSPPPNNANAPSIIPPNINPVAPDPIVNPPTLNDSIQSAYTPEVIFDSLKSLTLDNKLITSINKVPASRVIFKPIFMFFANFDDIQLYNYISQNLSERMENIFESIQRMEKQKWEILSYVTIWNQYFNLNLQRLSSYLNNTHRLAYTSQRFVSIQNGANGYMRNTLQFYLSYFILFLGFFFIANLTYKLLKYFNLSIKSWFSKFKLWLTFPVFLLEGNAQYMSYLMAFQLRNLWFLHPYGKFYAIFIILALFILLLCISSIYFLLKYLYEKSLQDIFENCQSNLKGIMYMFLISGIRNLTLGFLHQLGPETQQKVTLKIFSLLFAQIFFLLGTIYLIRICFFESKIRQWIVIWTAIDRIILVETFNLDIKTSFEREQLALVFSQTYCVIMIVFLLFWMASILAEAFLISYQPLKKFSLKVFKLLDKALQKSKNSHKNDNIRHWKRSKTSKQASKSKNKLTISVKSFNLKEKSQQPTLKTICWDESIDSVEGTQMKSVSFLPQQVSKIPSLSNLNSRSVRTKTSNYFLKISKLKKLNTEICFFKQTK